MNVRQFFRASRRRFAPALGVLFLLVAPGRIAAADKAPAVPAKAPKAAKAAPAVAPNAGFEAFRVIGDRNIFNANRISRSARAARDERPQRADTISFVGTMDYAKGVFAFFNSADSRFRKTLQEGEKIDEFTVARITADRVELVAGGKTITLKMAEQLRRPRGGEWTVVGAEIARNDARIEQVAEAAKAAEVTAPAPIPTDASETLRRLMEQRQKQLKQ
jgi:hypothetical protein